MTHIRHITGALLALFLLLGGHAAGQDWELAGTMPVPLAGGRAVTLDGMIYLLGGRQENSASSSDLVQVYDPWSESWLESSRMPHSRSGLAAAAHGRAILVLGGLVDSMRQAQRLLSRDESGWRTLQEDRLFDRTDGSAVVLGDRLILIGGYPLPWISLYSATPAIAEYDLSENRFIHVDSTAFTGEAPYHQLVTVQQSRLWIFGGVQFGISNKCYRYDPFDHSLTRLPASLLQPRAGGEAVTTPGGDIYLLGGYNESQTALSSVEIATIYGGSVTLREGPAMRHARRTPMAALAGDYLYVFGGYDERGYIPAAVEKLRITPNTGIRTDPLLASDFHLAGAWPNPFNSQTLISFTLTRSTAIRLEIFNLNGARVRLLRLEQMDAGEHRVAWDGTGETRQPLPGGIYFCRLATADGAASIKMTLLR